MHTETRRKKFVGLIRRAQVRKQNAEDVLPVRQEGDRGLAVVVFLSDQSLKLGKAWTDSSLLNSIGKDQPRADQSPPVVLRPFKVTTGNQRFSMIY